MPSYTAYAVLSLSELRAPAFHQRGFPRFDVKPSPATFGTLLKAYGQKNDINSVARVPAKLRARLRAGVSQKKVMATCQMSV